jgi:hypothetical protein
MIVATTTVIATAVIPISQLHKECANKFAGRIVFGYPCSVGRRLDKPYVLIAGSRPTAREVLILAAVIVSLCIIAAIVLL